MKHSWMPGMVLAVLALSACSKLSEANYARLKSGMTYEEVTQLIGKADHCDETLGIKQCVWGNDESNIGAKFIADKAVLFSSKNIR